LDSTIQVYRTEDLAWAFELTGHVSTVRGVDWSPDGTRIASASEDFTLKLWSVEFRELAASFPTDGVLNNVRWRPDGGAVAALGLDRYLHIWDATFADKISEGSTDSEVSRNR